MEFQMETRSLLNIYALVKNLVDFLSDPLPHLSLSQNGGHSLIVERDRETRRWHYSRKSFNECFNPLQKTAWLMSMTFALYKYISKEN